MVELFISILLWFIAIMALAYVLLVVVTWIATLLISIIYYLARLVRR